jgi:hypothetical protein
MDDKRGGDANSRRVVQARCDEESKRRGERTEDMKKREKVDGPGPLEGAH